MDVDIGNIGTCHGLKADVIGQFDRVKVRGAACWRKLEVDFSLTTLTQPSKTFLSGKSESGVLNISDPESEMWILGRSNENGHDPIVDLEARASENRESRPRLGVGVPISSSGLIDSNG